MVMIDLVSAPWDIAAVSSCTTQAAKLSSQKRVGQTESGAFIGFLFMRKEQKLACDQVI